MKRIQRKRTLGWKMPENTVSITRPGRFGNPFRIGWWYRQDDLSGVTGMPTRPSEYNSLQWSQIEDAQHAVDRFHRYIWAEGSKRKNCEINKLAMELKNKDVACWCKENEPCHGDVWLEYSEYFQP